MASLRRCPACGTYTLKEECGDCGEKTRDPAPPKYSPEDKYAHYRRKAKEEERKEGGLI